LLVLGLFFVLAAGGAAGALAWQNRDATVQVNVGSYIWHGKLYLVLAAGALLAFWFMLGAAFVQCRLAERARDRRTRREEVAAARPMHPSRATTARHAR
jgi:hypothetical protein